MEMKWPLTGGVPGQLFKEHHLIIQIYIAGYQDGSVRIWDASYPALSLVYNIKPEVSRQHTIQILTRGHPLSPVCCSNILIKTSVIHGGWRTMAESKNSAIYSCLETPWHCHPSQIDHTVCQKICHHNLPWRHFSQHLITVIKTHILKT